MLAQHSHGFSSAYNACWPARGRCACCLPFPLLSSVLEINLVLALKPADSIQIIVETSASAISEASRATAVAVAQSAEEVCRGGRANAAAQASASATASGAMTWLARGMGRVRCWQCRVFLTIQTPPYSDSS